MHTQSFTSASCHQLINNFRHANFIAPHLKVVQVWHLRANYFIKTMKLSDSKRKEIILFLFLEISFMMICVCVCSRVYACVHTQGHK